ncbi:TetR/AcrR family transcriptional regulator [Leeia oryzae]|uniref:TetR/AcrR family transcriptional regulator n=1 Tax=Leeia oryzae TaxID=356662 RepID=UPI00035D485B|nr:TetR/AcrR family transcriptional regulator [Leeia oryzae]
MNQETAKSTSRNEQRCEQILAAASTCFRQYGFHKASMSIIAKAAGMSVGHIYHYFENKEAIITAISEKDQAKHNELFDRFSEADDPLASMLSHMAEGVSDCTDPEQTSLMVEVWAEASRNTALHDILLHFDQAIRQKLHDLIAISIQKQGLPMPDETLLTSKANMMMALFEGLMVRSHMDPTLNRQHMIIEMQALVKALVLS